MPLKPYDSIDEMLAQVKNAVTPDMNSPEQRNAELNRFKYSVHVGPENQTIIVKQFNRASYNGPTTNDFIERLTILFETVKITLDKEKLAALENARKTTLDKISDTCRITPVENVDELLEKEKELIKIINRARHHLQEFVFKAVLLISPDAPKSRRHLEDMLLTIANNESTLTVTKGRPNFINYYPVKTTNRVSINRAIGQAIPSTERSGSKLPNFVECGVGYMNRDRYVSQFKGYRHSSYTPIKMIDKQYGDSNLKHLFGNRQKRLTAVNAIKFERRQAAALCAKDMFVELARQKMTKGVTKQPIEINLSSLAMLSPIKGDKTFMRRGESEHRQLKESYNALMMYDGRKIEIEVDGKKIAVKPLINIMNAASNWHGIRASRYMPSTLEKNINAEGMNKYITETEKHLNTGYLQDSNNLKQLLKNQKNIKQQLSTLYGSLDTYLSQTGNASTNTSYTELLKSIDTLRSGIYRIEHQILNERMNMLKEKRSEIALYIQTAGEIPALYYQSLFMYMDKKLEPAQFGARYLLVNEKLGKAVDFYCKSGEDRTGRMQNLIEELCEFSKEKGYFPRYDFDKKALNRDDEIIQRDIAKIVSERSVSRDNTNANAIGARGLQITSALELNTGLPNLSGSKMGTLARGVYDSVAIKKLWRAFQSLNTSTIKQTASDFVQRMKRMRDSGYVPLEENSEISEPRPLGSGALETKTKNP